MTGNANVGVLSVTGDLFRMAADVAPGLVWMSGADKLCTFFNKSWMEFTGRPIERELGNGWAEGVHPNDLQTCLDIYTRAFDRRDRFRMEYRLRRNDGEYRWVLDEGVPFFSPDGSFAGYIGSCVDITERRHAEDAVRRKEMELRESQRLAGVGSWTWESDTDTVVWSEELYHISGRSPRSGAVSYKDHGTLYSPESWMQLQRAVDEALRTGASYELDLEMIRADRTRIWVTGRGEVQRDATGRIVGLRGTVQDINERKQRENALALFRSLIDGSNDALEVIDPGTLRFLDVNEKACHDLGYSREELLSLTVPDIDATPNPSAKATLLGPCQFEGIHRRKDGSTFPVEVTIRPLTLDRPYYVAIVRDITDRRRAQEELRESEERLRLAAEAGKMFAYTWDAATDQILRSGDSDLLGVDPATPFTGRQLLEKVHPEDRHLLVSAFERLTPDTPLFQVNYRMIRPDGEVVWVERNSRAYFDEHGRVLRIIGMAADITQRKRGEEALSSISRRLIQAQEAERARIARDLHDDIGQRLALMAVTVQQLTHARLHARTRAASDEGDSLLDSLQTQTAEISSSVQEIAHELHSSRLQHLGVVAAMKGFCAELAAQQKVEVDFGHADVPPEVPAETSLCLFRVLQEALHNAVRHSGVRQFKVQLRRTADALDLTVRDKGLGFDPENVIDGRGLGLTSMKERLKLVGGELLIKSGSNRGTTIVARVPQRPISVPTARA